MSDSGSQVGTGSAEVVALFYYHEWRARLTFIWSIKDRMRSNFYVGVLRVWSILRLVIRK
jgi:hypothetical protein